MPDELPVVAQTYELAKWLLLHTSTFSRQYRYTLGVRLEEGILDLLDTLVEASYSRDKRALLGRANRRVERIRYLVRLSKDMRMLSVKQYEFASRSLFGIGAQVGGWQKQQQSAAE